MGAQEVFCTAQGGCAFIGCDVRVQLCQVSQRLHRTMQRVGACLARWSRLGASNSKHTSTRTFPSSTEDSWSDMVTAAAVQRLKERWMAPFGSRFASTNVAGTDGATNGHIVGQFASLYASLRYACSLYGTISWPQRAHLKATLRTPRAKQIESNTRQVAFCEGVHGRVGSQCSERRACQHEMAWSFQEGGHPTIVEVRIERARLVRAPRQTEEAIASICQ